MSLLARFGRLYSHLSLAAPSEGGPSALHEQGEDTLTGGASGRLSSSEGFHLLRAGLSRRSTVVARRPFVELTAAQSFEYLKGLPSDLVFERCVRGVSTIERMLLTAGYRASGDTASTFTTVLAGGSYAALYPDPSPDGSTIVYARAESAERGAKSEVWMMQSDGSNQRLLVADGTFPTFSADGRTVYFERSRKRVMSFSLATETVEEIFPRGASTFREFQVAKPRISHDGASVFFISDKGGRWQVWGADLQTGDAFHVHRGCEPVLSPDGRNLLWVSNRWWAGKTQLLLRSAASGATEALVRPLSAHQFEYFPSFGDGGRRVVFCAAALRFRWLPQRSSGARYLVWLLDLDRNVAIHVPTGPGSIRWPKLLGCS